ncbi:MAG: hypothetical protein IPP94_10990 [Ignavibacteria bacterium]|nr:hypothetical protein [Ignavibacteria bacterium]
MKNKLRSLYMLQLLDAELDELRESRGDLPDAVEGLAAHVLELQTRIEESAAALKIGATERSRKEKETLELIAKIDKYKTQQLQVQSNKEYDALTHEIDMAETVIRQYEEDIERFTSEAETIKAKKDAHDEQLVGLAAELAEKQEELKAVLAVTEEEENKLVSKREEALAHILPDDLEVYTRIRNARGKAIAPIRRGSCSGCYNIVPPQLILEIKKHNRVYHCEHCGRILISEDLAAETKLG